MEGKLEQELDGVSGLAQWRRCLLGGQPQTPGLGSGSSSLELDALSYWSLMTVTSRP